jgi:hypothetical protein
LISVPKPLKNCFADLFIRNAVLIKESDFYVIVIVNMAREKKLGKGISLQTANDVEIFYLHPLFTQSSL